MGLILALIADFCFHSQDEGTEVVHTFHGRYANNRLDCIHVDIYSRYLDTRYWIEGVNLHVIPFGWSIHSTVGSIVVSATIAGLEA